MIEDIRFTQKEKELIEEFIKDSAVSDNLSQKRIKKYYSTLRTLKEVFGFNFENPTTELIKEVILKVNSSNSYKEWTKRDFRIILRKYCKWFSKKFAVNLDTSIIKLGKVKNRLMLEEILTKEEVEKIINSCDNVRDKAMLSVLYEAGLRAGELLSLRIKSVIFDKYGAVLLVNGKTGQRRVRIVLSSKLLARWLEIHPQKDNPEAYLWVTKSNKKSSNGEKITPIKESGLRFIIKKACKKAGIKKRVYPHLFRHSRATHLASILPESVLKRQFGWTMDSKMVSTYVHLSGRDVDSAILSMYGVEIKNNGENAPKMIKCSNCEALNPEFLEFCDRCGYPLKETFLAKEERIEKIEKILVKFLMILAEKNPEIKREFYKLAKEEKIVDLFFEK